MITTMKEAEYMVYRSYLKARDHLTSTKDEIIKKPHLTRELLDKIGAPDLNKKIVLVTGSKGKGSTSRMISSLLSNLGYKVGLFTSPQLVKFNERIRIDGKMISDHDYIRLSNKIAPIVDEIESKLKIDEYQGPVGIVLALALLYFAEHNVDYYVIECGRGCKYDDTNVIRNQWAIITPIMEEHLNNLGSTIYDVVNHKLGIIKDTTKKVIIGRQQNDILANISTKVELLHNNGFNFSIDYYGKQFSAENIKVTTNGTQFSVITLFDIYQNLHLSLLGGFQAENGAVAIRAVEEILKDENQQLNKEVVENTFANLQWPGRLEIIGQNPTVIVDGTINRRSAVYVKEVVEKLNAKKIAAIIGVPEDKDYQGVIEVAASFADYLIITQPDITYKTFTKEAINVAKHYNEQAYSLPNLNEAVNFAFDIPDLDLLLIMGTQSLVANAKRIWK